MAASTPSAAWFLVPLALLTLAAVVFTASRRLSRGAIADAIVRSIDFRTASGLGRSATIGALALLALFPLLGGEAITFKFGLVLIFAIAAMGLHVLVNWTGQLSLAHAAMVGVPSLAIAKLSADHGISPLLLLPLAPLLGAVLGAVVSLPALRVRGLYVTIVTLALAIVVDRFLFSQQWLVGGGSFSLPVPTFAGIKFRTSTSLYPLLVALFVVVVVALRAFHGSKAVRAMLWTKANPEAAAAAGVDRGRYKILAYTIAGTLAGLAGGLTSVWVLRVTPTSFPLNLSFTYLLVVVLAGPGSVGGVIQAAAGLEGGRLIFSTIVARVLSFAGPISLIFVLTRIPAGLNGQGRSLVARLRDMAKKDAGTTADLPVAAKNGVGPDRYRLRLTPTFIIGVALILAGLVAIAVAWYHTGNTDQLWVQTQEVVLGAVGGIALVIVGTGLLIRDKHEETRATLERKLDEMADRLAPAADGKQRLAAVRKR
jgi:branched-chain amino acid transport system permease protein